MSAAPSDNANRARKVSRDAPPDKDLRGLMPYLRRYPVGIVVGLLMVVLMGIVGNVLPLATGVMTDTLAGNPVPFEHATPTGAPPVTFGLNPTTLSRSVPYYAPSSRRTLGIYCLIVIVCVAIKGLLSFSARWTLIGVSRDIEFDIRNDLLKRLLILEPEFYVRNRTGELMSRATNDLNAVRMIIGPAIMYSAPTISTMILAILVMVPLSPSLTLYVIIPAPVVAIALCFFGNTIHDLSEPIHPPPPTLTPPAH